MKAFAPLADDVMLPMDDIVAIAREHLWRWTHRNYILIALGYSR